METILYKNLPRSLKRRLADPVFFKEYKAILLSRDMSLIKIVQSKERTLNFAREYQGICFCKDHKLEYQHARKKNYIDELKNIIYKDKIIQSKERTLDIAREYRGTNFGIDHAAAYGHARNNKYLSEVNSALKKTVHSKERTIELAHKIVQGNDKYKYNTIRFIRKYRPEYNHAKKNNYIDELDVILKCRIKRMQKERTLYLAREYKGTWFSKDYKNEYDHARRNKYLKELKEILNNGKKI